MRKRLMSFLLILAMIMGMLPTSVMADEHEGQIHVIVENTTFTAENAESLGVTWEESFWSGTLLDTWVTPAEDDTMMHCIEVALTANNYSQVGADSNYISEINGLAEFDGGSGSGWMGTLNNWFTNTGFDSVAVEPGDEIRVMYTTNLGEDVGSIRDNNDTTVKALSFSTGELQPEFSKDTHEYTLKVSAETESVRVTPVASNKNYQVRTRVGETVYKLAAAVPVNDGTEIVVECNWEGSVSMNAGGETQTYTIHVVKEQPVVTASVNFTVQAAGAFLCAPQIEAEVSSNLAESYGYTDNVSGSVSALDVLVKAHQAVFGENFTAETAQDYLVIGSGGFATTIFAEETSSNGFVLNDMYPHDGTESSWGGYNGTTLATQAVDDGDQVDFFIYQDTSNWSDSLNWFCQGGQPVEAITAAPGEAVELTLKGYSYMYCYLFENVEALHSYAGISEIGGAQLAWVNMETGEFSALTDVVTAAENGTVTLTMPEEEGTYYLTAYTTGEDDSPLILNLTRVTVETPTVDISVYGHTAFFKTIEMHSYNPETHTAGEENFLAGVTPDNGTYRTSVPAGTYQISAIHPTDDTPLGSLVVEVTAEGNNDFSLVAVYGLNATNSGWVVDTDYTREVKISSNTVPERTFEMGSYSGASVIALYGDTVTLRVVPTEARPGFLAAETSRTFTSNGTLTVSCSDGVSVTFNVPAGSTVSVGTLKSYYVFNFLQVSEGIVQEDGTLNYTVEVPKNTDHFYRIQNPDGVTYWNYTRWNEAATVTISEEMLHIGDDSFTASTVIDDFSINKYDRGDIYVNINSAGCLDLQVGDTFELNAFRNWFAIESFMNSKVALPDAHYQVIDEQGNSTDIISVVPDTNNSNVAKITANGSGTAIVLVTYDAMTDAVGMGGTQFSAIWPECTGVVVVNVGDSGSLETNMIIDRMDAEASPIDSEHDILFYTGSDGASYSFTPEAGCTVTVARSQVGSKMSFNGFTSQGVTVSESGEVTVSGLTTGRHIVKIEKDGVKDYQVITARQVSYVIQDADGNELSADSEVKAGDTINIQFTGLVNPKEKLSGAYNFNASLYYSGQDGTYFRSNPGGAFGVYDFSSNPARQKISVTIPKYWGEDTYTLSGAIKMGGFAGVPTHRGITYAKGTNPSYDAPNVAMVLGALPEITIELAESDFLECTLKLTDENGNPVSRGAADITMQDSDGNGIVVADDGSFKALEEEFSYTIFADGYEYKTGTLDITAEVSEYTVILQTAGTNAWDGKTAEEPAVDEEGVYLISKASELAWLNQSGKTTFSAKLVSDIDMACYPWTAINSSGYSYTYKLDGDGHEIKNLSSTKGLFGTLGGQSEVKNLTVSGTFNTDRGAVGAIAGYLQRGTIENCVSNVNINATGNISNIGGIAGYIAGTVKNCVNNGTILTSGSDVGGITGYIISSDARIEGCYNTGAVSGTSRVGGIVGDTGSYAMNMLNCYNIGAVTGTADVGGIVGSCASGIIASCYNVGTVTGGNGFVGSFGSGAAFTLCYCLTDDEAAEKLTETEMKSADLGDGFQYVCNGYPALTWQEDVTAHTPDSQSNIVAPTCTEKGYTGHTCTNCGEAYRDTYLAALGHDWCDTSDDTECGDCVYAAPTCTEEGSITRTCRREGCEETMVDTIPATGHTADTSQSVEYPAYIQCVCDVCGVEYKAWNDDRLEHMTLPEQDASDIQMTDEGEYPWIYDESGARLISGNKGVDRSTSASKLSFTLNEGGSISFNYGVSSEANYDKLTIKLTKDGGDEVIVADAISGTLSDTYTSELEAGTYTLALSFAKDSSSAGGEDLGYISGVVLTANPHVHSFGDWVVTKEATCTEEGIQEKTCGICGEKETESIAKLAHTYGSWKVTKQATMSSTGTKVRTCSVCGHKETAVIAKLPQKSGVEGYVTRLYNLVLDRNPDKVGLNDWVDRLNSGKTTGADAAYGFIFSKEYQKKNTSNESYVDMLYQTILGRKADAAGKADWVEKLNNGVSRLGVLAGFTGSVEFTKICTRYGIIRGNLTSPYAVDVNPKVTAFAARMYTKVLGRSYDPKGLEDWTAKLINREIGGGKLSDGFFHSQEFLKKNVSDKEFLNICYRTYLGREADKAGFDYWMDHMAKGLTRDELRAGFIGSQEYGKLCQEYGIDR